MAFLPGPANKLSYIIMRGLTAAVARNQTGAQKGQRRQSVKPKTAIQTSGFRRGG